MRGVLPRRRRPDGPSRLRPGRRLPGARGAEGREPRASDLILALTAVVLLAVGSLTALSFLSA